MCTMPNAFHCIPDRFQTKEMCIQAVEVDQRYLYDVPDHFKTGEMCDKAVRNHLLSFTFHLDHVMDWCMSEDEKRWWK